MINTKELEGKLKNIAENIVGDIGEPTSDKRYSPTGEEFTEYGCQFKSFDTEDLMRRWSFTIDNLKKASFLKFAKRYRYIGDEVNPKLYWRILPEIKQHPDKDMYNFYVRLLISCNHVKYEKVKGIDNIEEFHIEELARGEAKNPL